MLRDFVEIKSVKFRIGIVMMIASLALNYCLIGQIKAGIILGILFLGAGLFKVKKHINEKVLKIIYVAWLLLSAFFTCYLSQLVLNETFLGLGIKKIFLSMCVYILIVLLCFILTLRLTLSTAIASLGLIIASVIDYYIFAFRGSEIQPADILSIQTAGNVAANYHVVISNTILYGVLLTGVYILIGFGLPKLEVQSKINSRIALTIMFSVVSILFYVESQSIVAAHFLREGMVTNGFILNFSLQLRETFIKKPEGYSSDKVQEIAEKYKESEEDTTISTREEPDIIVIMDESFADLSVLGSELKTDQQVTPFIDSLSENTIRGYALSSVYGGRTPNSEYEFLSGNSMMFLPVGSVVYQQYLKQPSYSMVGQMKKNGYKCISMHPYLSSGWMRNTVYPYLGFDKSYFIDDFSDRDMLRDYVSDDGMFKKLINVYETNKKQNQQVFLFGVTMQNHGAYDYKGKNYKQTISLKGYSKTYTDAEQYLSLIHETDIAVEKLIEYFKSVENNVVLVFYGDHFPNLNDEFYNEIHGGSFTSLDEQQLKYEIPFFIWTNYDIKEEKVKLTSLNFLSNYVYKVAGVQLPKYNKVLADINEEIPAMNANGYYSIIENKFLSYNQAKGKEADILNMYYQLEYNNIFDNKNRNNILFPKIKKNK